MSGLPRAGIGSIVTGLLLSIGGSVGFLFSDAPGWAKWGVPIVWGFFVLREGSRAYLRDWEEWRATKGSD
jgi:hypothetical protein